MDLFCRFCLEEDTSNSSFSSFTTEVENEQTVAEFYKIISNINFKNSEDLNNSKICESCLVKVHDIKDFRNTIILNNNTVLRIRKFLKLISLYLKFENIYFILESVLKPERIGEPIKSESPEDPLQNIYDAVEIKMEELEDVPDEHDLFPNLDKIDKMG